MTFALKRSLIEGIDTIHQYIQYFQFYIGHYIFYMFSIYSSYPINAIYVIAQSAVCRIDPGIGAAVDWNSIIYSHRNQRRIMWCFYFSDDTFSEKILTFDWLYLLNG